MKLKLKHWIPIVGFCIYMKDVIDKGTESRLQDLLVTYHMFIITLLIVFVLYSTHKPTNQSYVRSINNHSQSH